MKIISRLRIACLVLGMLLPFIIGLLLGSANAGEEGFEFFAKIDNGKYHFNIDTRNVFRSSGNVVKCVARIEPSPERQQEIRRSLVEANKEVEREFGAKVQMIDGYLNIAVRNETKEYMCEVDCVNKKLRLYGSVVIELPIRVGSKEEELLTKVCKDKT